MRPFVKQLVRAVCHNSFTTTHNPPSQLSAVSPPQLPIVPPNKSSTPSSQRPQGSGGSLMITHYHSSDSYLKKRWTAPPPSRPFPYSRRLFRQGPTTAPPAVRAYSQAGVGSEEYRAWTSKLRSRPARRLSRRHGSEAGKSCRTAEKGLWRKAGAQLSWRSPAGASATDEEAGRQAVSREIPVNMAAIV